MSNNFKNTNVLPLYHIYRGVNNYIILDNFGFDSIAEPFKSLKDVQKACKDYNNETIEEFKKLYNINLDSKHTNALLEIAIYEYIVYVHNDEKHLNIDYLLRVTKSNSIIIEGKYLGPQKADYIKDLVLILTPLCKDLNVAYDNYLNQYEITFKANEYNFFGANTSYFNR
jgi:hypothetical protein